MSPLDLPWNERIEFLGDSVLGLIISSLLWRKENELYSEGELSRLRAYLVSETRLSQLASEISLEDYILIAKVEEKKGGLKRESLLADCFEALVGAVYLDGGFLSAYSVVEKIYLPLLEEEDIFSNICDHKSMLQEKYQERYKITPHYLTINTEGPDHAKRFQVGVYRNKKEIACAWGKTKKKAAQKAASKALDLL